MSPVQRKKAARPGFFKRTPFNDQQSDKVHCVGQTEVGVACDTITQ